MGAETKRAKALEKLPHFTVKIGYPDKWRDYSDTRGRSPAICSAMSARGSVFEWNRKLVRLDEPVDRSEWGMTPQTVNAYYNPTLNEIVFPAAILQPPFFDPNADDAVNYGGIGAVIGHEIGHGFDDQGSKYDANGMLHELVDAGQDRKTLRGAHEGLVGAVSTATSRCPACTSTASSRWARTSATSRACTVAHAAYQLSLHGKPPPVLDGFTGEQRFFLGFGQVWRQKATRGLYAASACSPTRTARPNSASTARCATWTPGIRPST